MIKLRRAIQIAMEAHEGQVDKYGSPYILHPLCVMAAVTSSRAKIVAVLHDVVEDSEEWTIERLEREGFSTGVLDAVTALTKGEDEEYFDYIRRLSSVPLARKVKLADLADNLDRTRIPGEPSARDLERFERYEKAVAMLTA